MTTSPARISKTTQALIDTMREDQGGWSDEFRQGFRQALFVAVLADTPLRDVDEIYAYIDKQLAA